MSHEWISQNLEKYVGDEKIADLIKTSGYERWVVNVDANGTVTYKILTGK
jgi:hypothetical protein